MRAPEWRAVHRTPAHERARGGECRRGRTSSRSNGVRAVCRGPLEETLAPCARRPRNLHGRRLSNAPSSARGGGPCRIWQRTTPTGNCAATGLPGLAAVHSDWHSSARSSAGPLDVHPRLQRCSWATATAADRRRRALHHSKIVAPSDPSSPIGQPSTWRTPDNSRVSRKHYPDKNGPRRGPMLETIRTKMGQNGHQPGNFARTNRLLCSPCWNAVRTNIHGGRRPGLARDIMSY